MDNQNIMGMESGEKTVDQYLEERETIKDNLRSKLDEMRSVVADKTLSDEERSAKYTQLDTERQNIWEAWSTIEDEMLRKGVFEILANRRQ